MKSLNDLINHINNLEEIKRFKELEKIINNNDYYMQEINKIKDLQKKFVRTNNKDIKQQIDLLKDQFINIPIVSEYLDLIDEINHIIKSISDIISNQLKS